MRALALLLAIVGTGTAAVAQQSASYRMTEHVFNAGGRPAGGISAASASHRITLDALGDTVAPGWLTGGSSQLGGGFVTVYPPPGEVLNLRFSNHTTLTWNTEPSTGAYNLYRGLLATLPGLAYGSCRTSQVAETTTIDPDAPVPGQGYFYLVTAENLIAEEGIKGRASSGNLRANNAPCP